VDALIDGLNVELTNAETLKRRPGNDRYCSASVNKPLGFYAFRNIAGTTKLLTDSAAKVQTFTTTAVTDVYTKGATAKTRFQTVANAVYMCNGTDTKKWDGTTVSGWGIATPGAAPTLALSGTGITATSGYRYVFSFVNSSTGHVSTASPNSASTGAFSNKQVTVSGTGSADTQVDKINVYRTLDGGSLFYFLAQISNPGASAFNYADTTADSGLNDLISAPINHANDPVPAGASNVTFHMGRLWVSVSNKVYFAGGPDTIVGVPEEAWPTAYVFVFPGNVTAMASTGQGLVVFTATDAFIIRGYDTFSFFSQKLMANFGVVDQDCVTQDGDLLFIYTASRQLFSLSDSLAEVGFPIGDYLKDNFDPALSYLKLHRHGPDSGLFMSDGATKVIRYNVARATWCPVGQPEGGVSALASVGVGTSDFRLLMGRAADAAYILYRNPDSSLDDGNVMSSAYATIGTLVAAPLGETTNLSAVLVERKAVGGDPEVAVLLNEIAGIFTALPDPVPDPPLLPQSLSVVMKRHYLNAAQKPLPQRVRHLQVKITFPGEDAANELLGLALMPPA
jgi:hypothetical protein